MIFAHLIEVALWGSAFDKYSTSAEYQEIRDFAKTWRDFAYVELDDIILSIKEVQKCH